MSLFGLLSRSVRCRRWVGCVSTRVSIDTDNYRMRRFFAVFS